MAISEKTENQGEFSSLLSVNEVFSNLARQGFKAHTRTTVWKKDRDLLKSLTGRVAEENCIVELGVARVSRLQQYYADNPLMLDALQAFPPGERVLVIYADYESEMEKDRDSRSKHPYSTLRLEYADIPAISTGEYAQIATYFGLEATLRRQTQ